MNTILRAAFILILTMAMLTACAPEIEKPLGVYGDWTARKLHDGELRVCYSETTLNLSPEVNQDFSDVRLQVTNRSFDGGSAAIRFTEVQKLPVSAFLDFGSASFEPVGLEYLVYVNIPHKHIEVVNEMKQGEIEGVEMTLKMDREGNTDTSVAPLGNYSLNGFTDAYDAISKACQARTADIELQPILLTDLSVVKEPSLYVEFNVTGPFFEADNAEKLTIRGIPNTDEMPSDNEIAISSPKSLLRAYTDQMEFYRNGVLVTTIDQSHPEFSGICLDPESRRLKLLMETWSGGATDPGSMQAVYFEPDAGIGWDILHSSGMPRPPLYNCAENERSWGEGKQFIPCQCAGRTANQYYVTTLNELVYNINYTKESEASDISRNEIDDDTLSALLNRISRLQPFMWWDASSRFEVEQFESSKFAIVSITYYSDTNDHDSVQHVFVRRLSGNYWTRVYRVQGNRRNFNTATIHEFYDDDNLDLDMCVEDCDWRGEQERVQINVEEWIKSAAEDG